MQTNIHGGGSGVSANTGSSVTAVTYLEHERIKAEEHGIKPEDCQGMLFTQDKEGMSINDAADMFDTNKKGLHKEDAKFFMLDVNPSQAEQAAMFKDCKTDREREKVMQDYVRQQVMNDYAANFKGYKDRQTKQERQFKADDLVYVAAIHRDRRTHQGEQDQWHAHVVVSRETKNGEYKISPQANNRKENGKGPVKAAFERTNFYKSVESSFDRRFGYQRKPEERFENKNQAKKEQRQEVLAAVQGQTMDEHDKHLQEIDRRAIAHYNEVKAQAIEEANRREAVRRAEREEARKQREAEKERQQSRGGGMHIG